MAGCEGRSGATGQTPDGKAGRRDAAPGGCRTKGRRDRPTSRRVGSRTGGKQTGAGEAEPGVGEGAETTARAAEKFRRRTNQARCTDQRIAGGEGRTGAAGQALDGDADPR